MRFLRTLGVGDRFRVAHPKQVSLNRRQMSRVDVFKITKVYPMSPHLAISVMEKDPDDGFYSLGPGTPVLLPRELNPTQEEVLNFLGVKPRKQIVAYRVNWDGKSDISKLLTPQAFAIMKMLFALGKTEYDAKELNKTFNDHYEQFLGRSLSYPALYVFNLYRRNLVSKGLIDEILDNSPVPSAVVEANLQEAYNDD